MTSEINHRKTNIINFSLVCEFRKDRSKGEKRKRGKPINRPITLKKDDYLGEGGGKVLNRE